MESTERNLITPIDEQHYIQKIIDFILNNPGYTAEDILKNNKGEIGRKRLFTILKKLKRKKTIIEKKLHKKGRNKMLFVSEDNPLYIISKELREFEDLYPNLLKKLKEKVELWQSGKAKFEYTEELRDPVIADQHELFLDSTLFLFEIMRIYMLRSVMVWSRTIQDKYTREIVNFTIFSKLYRMQVKISEILGDVTLERAWDRPKNAFITSVATELSEIKERIEIALSRLSSYKIKKEIEPISNFIIKIIKTELARQKIYSDSSTYKWNINIDDVEGLANSMAKDNPTRSEADSDRVAAASSMWDD
jgi:hypothetical protein